MNDEAPKLNIGARLRLTEDEAAATHAMQKDLADAHAAFHSASRMLREARERWQTQLLLLRPELKGYDFNQPFLSKDILILGYR
jgi:hypothetical protein